jgi:tetratricopeptide (TPR) repeat protein
MVMVDALGNALTCRHRDTARAWQAAFDDVLWFRGDPLGDLDAINDDSDFVVGPVLCAAYRILGGVRTTDAAIQRDMARLASRAGGATQRERDHADATVLLVAGEFDLAAQRWAAIATEHPRDLLALKLTHDVCLHIGDDDIRLPSAQRAVDSAAFERGERAHGVVQGMLAFALEEVGRYEEAERWGRRALELWDDDLWARHALAHVYESTGNHAALMELLVPTSDRWAAQPNLSNHVWWHIGVRHLHHGDHAAATEVLDEQLVSTTAFGLADAASLRWRLDLAGHVSSAAAWRSLADRWAATDEQHTCAFLDLHAALAVAACGDDSTDLVRDARQAHAGDSFNDRTFRDVLVPLAEGLQAYGRGDYAHAAATLTDVVDLRRVGGSVVQRDIVARTAARCAELVGSP